jgi:hypothetical protein
MHKIKRRRRAPRGEWGVVEVRSTDGSSHGAPIWFAYWMELRAPGRVSIEIDPDRDATVSPGAWRRARQAFGPPLVIRVLDDETAGRVRGAVPARVTVVVTPDDRRLQEMATICDDDGLDRTLTRALS